jgi:hypothetical protein
MENDVRIDLRLDGETAAVNGFEKPDRGNQGGDRDHCKRPQGVFLPCAWLGSTRPKKAALRAA